MDEKQSLKNADIKIAEIIQQLKLLDFKIHVIKTNDLKHLQQRIDSIYRFLFLLGAGIITQLLIAMRTVLTG